MERRRPSDVRSVRRRPKAFQRVLGRSRQPGRWPRHVGTRSHVLTCLHARSRCKWSDAQRRLLLFFSHFEVFDSSKRVRFLPRFLVVLAGQRLANLLPSTLALNAVGMFLKILRLGNVLKTGDRY